MTASVPRAPRAVLPANPAEERARARLDAHLARLLPELGSQERAWQVQRLLSRWLDLPTYSLQGAYQHTEAALVRYWREPTPAHAAAYLATLGPSIGLARRREERRSKPALPPPLLPQPVPVGPYLADRVLGQGGDGVALHAVHVETGREVALKIPPRGDAWLPLRMGWWPESILETLDGGDPDERGVCSWIAREYADETLHTYVGRRRWQPLPREEALATFRVCCEGAAWLHERRVYRWSAHAKNVYRVGQQWKIGDFGRSVCFLPEDDPMLRAIRWRMLEFLEIGDALAQECAELVYELSWGHPTSAGLLPEHSEREQRLRRDDCAMLGGLLCDLLTGRRWEWFHRALSKQPYCSAHYPLTGDPGTDERLSAILNRCWRGDAGGAPLLANDVRGAQSVYENPLELLADVAVVLGASPFPS